MKIRYLITLLPILFVSSVSAQVLSINQFSGINSDDSPLTLQNGQTPDSRNLLTDDGPGVQGRKGFVQYSTESSSGLYEFPLSNGTRYLITKSGSNLKATTDGKFSVLIGTVPTDRIIAVAVLGDKFFYSDTLNGLKYWDGTSVTTSSRTLTFDKLVTFKGRLVGAGKSGSERVLFLSKYLDGTAFTLVTNPSDDDPTQITVSGSLDETIQALYSTFQDKLIYFKKNSFGGLSGSRRSNFALRVYSDSIGVSSVETIRDCDGKLRWLGNNRKVYQFDGATFGIISEDIDNIFINVSQGDASSTSWSQTTQLDFGSGYSNNDVFQDTTTTADVVKLTFPDPFDSFRDGTNGSKPVWDTDSSAIQGVGTSSITSGALDIQAGGHIGDPAATLFYAARQTQAFPNFSAGVTYYFEIKTIGSGPSAVTGNVVYFHLMQGSKVSAGALTAEQGTYFYLAFAPTTTSGQIKILNSKSSSGSPSPFNINLTTTVPCNVSVYIDSAKFQYTINGSSIVQKGTMSWTTGSVFPSFLVQNGNAGGGQNFQVDYFDVVPQTVTFASAVHGDSSLTSWGPFQATTIQTNGTQTFGIRSSTSQLSNSSTFTYTSIIPSAVPTVSVSTWFQINDAFTTTSTGAVNQLSDFTQNFGQGSNVHAASAYIQSRYWLGLAISSASNNGILVYDKQNQWQRYDGYVPEVMSLYNSRLYVGNTNGVFLSESGYADNNVPITAYYTTKTFAPGGFDYFGQYDHLYLTTDNSDDTLTPTFQINNNATDNSFGSSLMNGTLGIQNLKYPFSMAQVQQGKFINMKWSVNGSSFWRILNGDLYFTPSANPD